MIISATPDRGTSKKNSAVPLQNSPYPWRQNKTSNTLSRHPTDDHNPPKMILHDDTHSIQNGTTTPPLHIPTQLIASVCTDNQSHSTQTKTQVQELLFSSLNSICTINWEQVQTATSSDYNMLLLLSTIEDGIPEYKYQLLPSIREYHPFQRHLQSVDGVIIYKDRIVIPPSLRPSCLSALHAADQVTSTLISKAEASIS